jgi:hypothetical protein
MTAALAITGAVIAGCGGSDEGSDGGDGGREASSKVDSRAPDSRPHETGARDSHATADSGQADAGPDCGSVPPSGSQLVATENPVDVLGLTTDNYAVYLDTNAQSLSAVPLAGGPVRVIGATTAQSGTAWINGASVLFLNKPADPTTGLAPLSAWSAATGAHAISPSVFGYDSYYYSYDVDPTGAHLAYLASTDGATATLTLAALDGTMATPLVTRIDLGNFNCPPILQFVGQTLLATYCSVAGASDAGANATVATFAAPSFTMVTLATVAPTGGPMTTQNPAGTGVLLSTAAGLVLYPLAGGTPTTIDATGTGGSFTTAGDLVYTTTAGALNRWSAMSGTTVTLVPSQMNYLLTLSPDDQWVQVAKKVNNSNGLSDIFLASATTPGAATVVWDKATASPIGFSADSMYSTFGVGFSTTFGAVPFDVEVSKVSGGTPTQAAQCLSTPQFTSGSTVIVNDDVTKATAMADIESIDLAGVSGKKTLVTQADQNSLWASGQLVYSWHCTAGPKAGVWALPVP